MRCIDLTQTIKPGMPVYPGTEPPLISRPCTIEQNGFVERKLTFYSHTGTHLDSPAHIIKEGITLDRLPLEHFFGPAMVIDAAGIPGQEIPVELLNPLDGKKVDFVIFHTGWYHKWGEPGYFQGYPVLAPETAHNLAQRGIKGVGIDAVSVDPVHVTDFAIHKILLSAGLVIIENLTNLKSLAGKEFILYCFPLKIEMADGSPVRAAAVLE